MKVALVHDWLTNLGGAERVVDALHTTYPDAPIFTSVYDSEGITLFKDAKVITSYLQRWPLAKKKHQLYPTLRRYSFESFDFSSYDVVISSSSAEAKGIVTPTETTHICYMHTPTRYYWSGYEDYLKDPGFGILNPIVRLALSRMINKLRYYDYAAAQRADIIIANSHTVARRIKKYYNRDAQVIYPPVDTARFASKKPRDKGYYLVVSRLIPYKKIDLAIKACNEMNKVLVVVGTGSELGKLRAMAGENVAFVESASDEIVTRYVKNCTAFLFPGFEDFGITPVEAMAAGKPVIAFGEGGASETVVDGKTGVLFAEQTVEALKQAITKFEKIRFSSQEIAKHAQKFSIKNFQDSIQKVVNEAKTKN